MTAALYEIPSVTTAAQRQAEHAMSLAAVLQRTDLPVLVWQTFPSGNLGHAHGASDRDVVRIVRSWAHAFNARWFVESRPRMVPIVQPWGEAYRLEPGRISVRISPGMTVVGDLVELNGVAV